MTHTTCIENYFDMLQVKKQNHSTSILTNKSLNLPLAKNGNSHHINAFTIVDSIGHVYP